MLPGADQMVMEMKEDEMLEDDRIFCRGGSWWVRFRRGGTVIVREAGPDRDCAEAVLQLLEENH